MAKIFYLYNVRQGTSDDKIIKHFSPFPIQNLISENSRTKVIFKQTGMWY